MPDDKPFFSARVSHSDGNDRIPLRHSSLRRHFLAYYSKEGISALHIKMMKMKLLYFYYRAIRQKMFPMARSRPKAMDARRAEMMRIWSVVIVKHACTLCSVLCVIGAAYGSRPTESEHNTGSIIFIYNLIFSRNSRLAPSTKLVYFAR